MKNTKSQPKVGAEFDEMRGFFLKIDSNFPSNLKQRNTVVKYTKLPDFDFDSKASWTQRSYILQPRLRRIIELDDFHLDTSHSLKPEFSRSMTSGYAKRKIGTITEVEENNFHPKFSKEVNKYNKNKTDGLNEKTCSQRTVTSSTLSILSSKKSSKNTRPDLKTNTVVRRASLNKTLRNSKNVSVSPANLGKKILAVNESEKEICVIKNKFPTDAISRKDSREGLGVSYTRPLSQSRTKVTLSKEFQMRHKPVTVIHVPLEIESEKSTEPVVKKNSTEKLKQKNCGTQIDLILQTKNDIDIFTNLKPITKDKMCEVDHFSLKYYKCVEDATQTETIIKTFDSLDVPNVTLIKDKSDISKVDVVKLSSKSLPNLKIPTFKITSNKAEEIDELKFSRTPPYIIGRATVTYTTKQKIDFQVVGSNEDTTSEENFPSHLAYPMNVVSVFKKEYEKREKKIEETEKKFSKDIFTDFSHLRNELKSVNVPYSFNKNNLVKPSDIISTISVNDDYISEQFQRELNFIDSFFESLQYLESCSLTSNYNPINREKLINNKELDLKTSEYNSFLKQFQNDAFVDDNVAIASKSLCLLNLLIRDEQRRAKNLLVVLKTREDALKDFTKSQILWLENKKKQDNTDISTLKKKQRGVLLKLHHECGEMQRMRKTLLTLSKKRKNALIKTKKNIELKLRNNVDLDCIFVEKKKLKKNMLVDRTVAPLKCFDLSNSGCEESITSRPKSEILLLAPEQSAAPTGVTYKENSIQTGDSIGGTTLVDRSTEAAAENFVVVDGGYLNILFHNLSLPQIFSGGKQYEVNEKALKDIVNTTNTQHDSLSDNYVFSKFMDHIKNCEVDKSSTPSTARSLVEELDQYYKLNLVEDEPIELINEVYKEPKIFELKDTYAQVEGSKLEKSENTTDDKVGVITNKSSETMLFMKDVNGTCNIAECSEGCQTVRGKQTAVVGSQTIPLPTTASSIDISSSELPVVWLATKTSPISTCTDNNLNNQLVLTNTSVTSLTSPVHVEAEELKRQQLAIEREIKALEQQQCQLLVVREIPDKPPPPYTPPTEYKPKTPSMFDMDETAERKISKYIDDPTANVESNDAFELFLKDFVIESLERQKVEKSDKPWDACNILPKKPEVDKEKLVKNTAVELKQVLSGVAPSIVSGMSSRRSDNIDDILFEEWRRCEPEWTTLHPDELIVKNQVFEGIFQKVLTETIDEYKKTVLCEKINTTE